MYFSSHARMLLECPGKCVSLVVNHPVGGPVGSACGLGGPMRSQLLGEHALLIECTSTEKVRATYALLRSRAAELGAVEVVPAARSVLIDGLVDVAAARRVLETWE